MEDLSGDQYPFHITEKIGSGYTLFDALSNYGAIKPGRALNTMLSLVDTVRMIDSCGYVHGDIKPENIVLDGKGKPYLVDFGLATAKSTDLSKVECRRGTIGYLPPEYLISGSDATMQHNDTFALWTTFYQLLNRALPLDMKHLGSDSAKMKYHFKWMCHGNFPTIAGKLIGNGAPKSLAENLDDFFQNAFSERFESVDHLYTQLTKLAEDHIDQMPKSYESKLSVPSSQVRMSGDVDQFATTTSFILVNSG